MSEEELEKTLDEIFKEDIEMIRERMKVLMRGYDKALTKLVEKDKVINLMAIDLEYLNKEILDERDRFIYKENGTENKQDVIDYYYKEVEDD